MNESSPDTGNADAKADFDENAVCEACGRYGAFVIGNHNLCGECYEGCGSCCPEFTRESDDD